MWREIGRRNASAYARAVGLLSDLKALAIERGLSDDFAERLAGIRERHAQKSRFLERLTGDGL